MRQSYLWKVIHKVNRRVAKPQRSHLIVGCEERFHEEYILGWMRLNHLSKKRVEKNAEYNTTSNGTGVERGRLQEYRDTTKRRTASHTWREIYHLW